MACHRPPTTVRNLDQCRASHLDLVSQLPDSNSDHHLAVPVLALVPDSNSDHHLAVPVLALVPDQGCIRQCQEQIQVLVSQALVRLPDQDPTLA